MTHLPEIQLDGYINRLKYFLDTCSDKKVLHLGCSSGQHIRARIERGSLLHSKLNNVASVLHGLDLDEDSLKVMSDEYGIQHLHHGNAEKLEEADINEKFDIVLAGDLLEHLTCPGAMLEGIKPLLLNTGRVVISTNNAFGLNYQIRRWTGNFIEHFEHVCFFSPETLLHLFERHGYKIIKMYGAYTEPPYTLSQKLKFTFGAPLYKIFPVLAGTLVVIAEVDE